MSSRHTSNSGSPRGGHTPSSASYHSQQPSQQQQYLRPEDVYRIDRESSYLSGNAQSYNQSRHDSATSSPRHTHLPTQQRLPSHDFSPASFDPYAYQSEAQDPFLSPARRVTPPDEMAGISRHSASYTGSRCESPNDFPSGRAQRSESSSPKDKGKKRDNDNKGDDRRRSGGNGRHEPSGNGGKRKDSGPNNRLVSGVFIRY